MTGPRGAPSRWWSQAEGNVAEGEIQLLDSRSKLVEVHDRPERIWFQEQLPDGAGRRGTGTGTSACSPARRTPSRPPRASTATSSIARRSRSTSGRGKTCSPRLHQARDQKPEAIMLSWHDGKDWEHRAYWGEDKFTKGKPDTAEPPHDGPAPEGGRVGPAGSPRGGSSTWRAGRSGGWAFTLLGRPVLLAPRGGRARRRTSIGRNWSSPGRSRWQSAGQGAWSGRFPLDRDDALPGRAAQRTGPSEQADEARQGHGDPRTTPRRSCSNGRGRDLVLSTPAKVPAVDRGVRRLRPRRRRRRGPARRLAAGSSAGRSSSTSTPSAATACVATLDLPGMDLKAGEHVRYRVEARDRKGQSAQTQEYVVRIANDGNAADKQLENYDKGQDAFRENLVKLIAEQAKVQETIKAMTAQVRAARRR